MAQTSENLADSALQADIAALRERVTDTREIYREVCGLLFFRYGVTPTAGKLYQLVRKGSMGVPGEVLAQFWQTLREKTRVKIDHPEMPEAIRQVAAEAVQGIWLAAAAAASDELAHVRADVEQRAVDADTQRHQAQTALDFARREIAAEQGRREELAQQLAEAQEALQEERAAHAASKARLEEMRAQVEERDRQLAAARTQFSEALEHTRQQIAEAQERAVATERRVMLELDQERVQRQRSERTADELRTELAGARAEHKEASIQHASITARLQSELQSLTQRIDAAAAERGQLTLELEGVRSELADALRRAERAESEVEVTRRLVAELRRPPAPKSTKGAGRRDGQ
ncbi:DNA-binding protein [Paraburkholderia sp. A3RO-2L]|jgi:DNA repair exonuclease SbcCD ATPase subunit|uniref:DNA-binding protein n=1 Tax=unclassified Paraburkholderia TaxID=2615204 RepID=UPI0032F6373A|nr:DNA-binding protein [Burkholderia vietnamiensis]